MWPGRLVESADSEAYHKPPHIANSTWKVPPYRPLKINWNYYHFRLASYAYGSYLALLFSHILRAWRISLQRGWFTSHFKLPQQSQGAYLPLESLRMVDLFILWGHHKWSLSFHEWQILTKSVDSSRTGLRFLVRRGQITRKGSLMVPLGSSTVHTKGIWVFVP